MKFVKYNFVIPDYVLQVKDRYSFDSLIMLREVKLNYDREVNRLAVKPRIIGKGSPGNMLFLSSILNDKKHPNNMLMMEAAHEMRPKFSSMCPESIE